MNKQYEAPEIVLLSMVSDEELMDDDPEADIGVETGSGIVDE